MTVPFDPDRLVSLPPRVTTGRHDARDVMLYALGVGAGSDDPTGAEAMRYCYEANLAVLPTMAVVMAWPGFWLAEPQYGIDWKRLLHAEQSLEVHRPLPPEGEIVSELRIERIVDKGADKGSLLYSRRDLYAGQGGALIATERRASFLRGNGGHGSVGGEAPRPHALPDRPADASVPLATRRDQALLYRLSGDRNPLHVDPSIAEAAGFGVPILHGLCTYGVVARALLRELCGGDAAGFRRMDCRFSLPAYPGDTIVTEIWREADGRAAFQARAMERGQVVLSNGRFDYD